MERVRYKWIVRSFVGASSKKSKEIGNYMHSLFSQDTSQAAKYLSIRQRITKAKPVESRFSRRNRVRNKSNTSARAYGTIFKIKRDTSKILIYKLKNIVYIF